MAAFLLLEACSTYGMITNATPAQDLSLPVRVESVFRTMRAPDGTPALRVRVWLSPTSGDTIVMGDSALRLLTALEPRGLVAFGVAMDQGVERRALTLPLVAAPGRATVVVFAVPLPGDLLSAGSEYGLRLHWLARERTDTSRVLQESRLYRVRIIRTNYALAAGLGFFIVAGVGAAIE